MILLDNGRVYAFNETSRRFVRHRSVLIDGARIVALDETPAGIEVQRRDLQGATVLPAFADCHVHITDTGYFIGERNLGSTRSYADYETAVARLRPEFGVVFAGQYDESTWSDGASADARILERCFPDARAMLVRIDGHSCLVNRATLEWLALAPDTRGIERDAQERPTGKLFLDANWRAQSAFMAALPVEAKRAADRRAVELALAHGAVHLHAQLVGFERAEYSVEIEALRALPGKWYPKVCEPDPHLAVELGLPFIGGDVFLDGSIGSCTAALSQPYVGDDATALGELRYSDDQVYAYFATAEALGISAGVHAIGDRAIEQCIATWERVLGGKPSIRGTRHFIEHFEIARPDHIEACARMGIFLSMQPQFDALWGGADRMYDRRLGTARMRSMNALGRALRAGAVLCGGDDSPVCDLNPLMGMQAAVDHHEPAEQLDPHEALAMYTVNAACLGVAEMQTGNIRPGLCADLVVLDADPLDGTAFTACNVLEAIVNGTTH
jgi:predicted amidohydrolase YtcJ